MDGTVTRLPGVPAATLSHAAATARAPS